MEEYEVLRDVLERLDRVTQHIIEIKADMCRKSEHREDTKSVYEHISEIEHELTEAIKDAVATINRELIDVRTVIKTVQTQVAANVTAINKPTTPRWVIAILSGALALAGQQLVQFFERAFSPH